jgi:hypothetical protein
MKHSNTPRLARLFSTLASLSVAGIGCHAVNGPAVAPVASGAETPAPDAGVETARTEPVAPGVQTVPPAPPPSPTAPPPPASPITVAGAPRDKVCDGPGTYNELAGITPRVPVDYIELRVQLEPERGIGRDQAIIASKAGRACATAKNPSACATALANVTSSTGWSMGFVPEMPPGHRYVVFTRGDEVGMITSLDALAAFLAPIDTAGDAALLVTEDGQRVDCAKQARVSAAGVELTTNTGHTCGAGTGIDEHLVKVSANGKITVVKTTRIAEGHPHCVVGRRPEGYALARSAAERALGAHFAEIAQLEAASVYAFERLARELEAHGAPADLIAAARDAAWDEVRHAKTTSALAKRFGGAARAPEVPALGVRTLLAIALENAAEGCVRETFGALQATLEARQAADPAIARAMQVIAADETRHAGLAWDVAAWLEPRLAPAERAQVEDARREAAAGLGHDLAAFAPAAEVTVLAGVPDAAQASWLFAQARAELWA